MTDRTPEQLNNAIDRLLEVAAESSRNADITNEAVRQTAQTVTELAQYSTRRLEQHDLELDDHDVRVERLERDHIEHADRMVKLEEIQADLRTMMQILTRRLSGEP